MQLVHSGGSHAKLILDQHPNLNYPQACSPAFWQAQRGHFAFVFTDPHEHKTLLVRDHMGFEPLYYTPHQGQVIYGSNLPDILQQLPYTSEWNSRTLTQLFLGNQTYSDETFYQGIYRVDPGTIVTIDAKGNITKQRYWQLAREGETLSLANDQAYLERFAELMHDSIKFNIGADLSQVAGELSGGLDASSIITTAHHQGLHYPLFMQIAEPNDIYPDDRELAEQLLNYIGHQQAHYFDAADFEPLKEFRFCAEHFAGPAPYILFMFAQITQRPVAASGKTILLSGAGGDECVSSHAVPRSFYPQYLREHGARATWQALAYETKGAKTFGHLRRAEKLVQYAHPYAYSFLRELKGGSKALLSLLRHGYQKPARPARKNRYFHSVRDFEWDRLQGPSSHPIHHRLEYSAVIGKAMGFEYRYPLLDPKLLEFCISLPLSQKRRQGVGRYLIRQYLQSTGIPESIYNKNQKVGGIVPAAISKCMRLYNTGAFDQAFANLPYIKSHMRQLNCYQSLMLQIHAYMLQYWQSLRM